MPELPFREHEAVERAAAQGVQVICFAELAFDPFYPQEEATPKELALAEPVPGPTTEPFSALSAKLGVVLILNVFEREGDRTFDTSPVIDADGRLLGSTRMVHITDYPCFHEQGYYAPGEWPEGLYEAEMQVAAFQNGFFTALCNRVGAEPRLTFAGESFVCDPAGRVVARAGQGTEEILLCDLDLDRVAHSDARRLFLRDRRPELYTDWIV